MNFEAVGSEEMERCMWKMDGQSGAGGWDTTRPPGKKRNRSGPRTKREREEEK